MALHFQHLQSLVISRGLASNHHSLSMAAELQRAQLLEVFSRSHAAIVPTRNATSTEGMPQVCAEAVLSGLPVIASSVTANCSDVIEGAAIRCRGWKIASDYGAAILRLLKDEDLRTTLPNKLYRRL